MSSLACRLCGSPIKFNDKHISQKTGKKIPLDVETNERHDCPAGRDQQQQKASQSMLPEELTERQQQQRRHHQCNKGCGQEIYFDPNNKTQRQMDPSRQRDRIVT
ncbi:MAG: hypothetical protein ACJ72F_05985 [Nitrososphaeraceae archaeon]